MPNTNDTQPTNERTRAQVTTARTVAEAARKTGEKVQSRIIIVENLADTSLVIDQAGDPNTVVEPSAEALSAAALSPIMRRLAALEATPTPAATVAEFHGLGEGAPEACHAGVGAGGGSGTISLTSWTPGEVPRSMFPKSSSASSETASS